jgi:ABC-type transport system substrate-binding protein
VPPDLVPLLKQSDNLNVGPRLTTGVYYTFVMNHLQAPFANPAIRQDVTMAVNQSDYLMAATGALPENGGTCRSYYTCNSPYASDCKNRCCPKCHSRRTLRWLEARTTFVAATSGPDRGVLPKSATGVGAERRSSGIRFPA